MEDQIRWEGYTVHHMIAGTSGAQLVTAWAAATTAGVALVTGTVAVLTLLAVKQDSRDRSRPIMTAEIKPRPLTIGTTELIVTNAGRSVARNINVQFEPKITAPDTQHGQATLISFLKKRYATPIATLAPGSQLTNVYSQKIPHSNGQLREPVPEKVKVTITYADDHETSYTSEYSLDIDTAGNTTTTNPANTDEKGLMKRWATALETIARGVGRI